MTLQDLKNIGELCLEAGHNPDRILIFLTEDQYKEEFGWMDEVGEVRPDAKVIEGPLFAGIPTLALIRYAGYSYYVIDHNRMDETIQELQKRKNERAAGSEN